MAIEFELKFRATPEALEKMQAQIPGEQALYQMQTTYYDTPGGALSARRYTLRRRMENHSSICALKLPAQGYGRQEFEVQCNSIEEALPALCKLSGAQELPQLLQEGLVPLCGARFTRIAKTVQLPDCTVEVALDSGVLTGGGREQPLWEAEVELKAGSREGAIAYAAQLALAYGLTREPLSKFRRAQLLAQQPE